MWASQWDATGLNDAVPEPSHRAIQTNQGHLSLCALQELPRAPRWPCRAPSPAGMGPSSSSGRPATSTGTAPREKTRASCAVSRWGCPSPAHAYSPLPPSPQAHVLPSSCASKLPSSKIITLPHVLCHSHPLSGDFQKLHGLQETELSYDPNKIL